MNSYIINVYHQQRPENPTEKNPHCYPWEPAYESEDKPTLDGIPWKNPYENDGDAGSYKRVATVPSSREGDPMEDAWRYTNNIDKPWVEWHGTALVVTEEGQRVSEEHPLGLHRSSMVGDVFEVNSFDEKTGSFLLRKFFMVDRAGYKEMV
jgi:hypothetical protein